MARPASSMLSRVSPVAGAALGCAILAVLVAVFSVLGLLRTFTSASGAATAQAREQEYQQQFLANLKKYSAQLSGRSLFMHPRAPRSDARAETPPPARTDSTVPSRYGGPSIIAMINNSVWLSNGDRIPVGHEVGGVRVVSINPPWSARLAWRGGEFDVSLFDRDAVVYRPTDAPPVVGSAPAWAPPRVEAAATNSSPGAPGTARTLGAPPGPAPGQSPPSGSVTVIEGEDGQTAVIMRAEPGVLPPNGEPVRVEIEATAPAPPAPSPPPPSPPPSEPSEPQSSNPEPER